MWLRRLESALIKVVCEIHVIACIHRGRTAIGHPNRDRTALTRIPSVTSQVCIGKGNVVYWWGEKTIISSSSRKNGISSAGIGCRISGGVRRWVHIPELIISGIANTDLVRARSIAVVAAIYNSHLIVGLEQLHLELDISSTRRGGRSIQHEFNHTDIGSRRPIQACPNITGRTGGAVSSHACNSRCITAIVVGCERITIGSSDNIATQTHTSVRVGGKLRVVSAVIFEREADALHCRCYVIIATRTNRCPRWRVDCATRASGKGVGVETLSPRLSAKEQAEQKS